MDLIKSSFKLKADELAAEIKKYLKSTAIKSSGKLPLARHTRE